MDNPSVISLSSKGLANVLELIKMMTGLKVCIFFSYLIYCKKQSLVIYNDFVLELQ